MPLPILAKVLIVGASMALNMSRHIEGPRLDDLKYSGGNPNEPWVIVIGRRRVVGLPIWARDLREVVEENKTKGGKYNNYKYFADVAWGIAGHEISAVSRIWLDKKLVFDLTGAGPVTPFDFGGGGANKIFSGAGGAGAGGQAIGDWLAIYFGTPDQDPDPYMQAFIETEFAEGWCPAYRNRSYAVAKNLPVEKFGNRFPQPEFEVLAASTGHIPTEQRDVTLEPNVAFAVQLSSDCSRLAWLTDNTPGGLEVWDVAARAQMFATPSPYSIGITAAFGTYNNGDVLAYHSGSTLTRITPDGDSSLVLFDNTVNREQTGCRVVADGTGAEHWGTYPYSFYHRWFFDGVLYEPGFQACHYFADTYGNVWVVGRTVAATAVCHFMRLVTVDNALEAPDYFTVTMPDTAGVGGSGDGVQGCGSGEHLVVDWAGKLHLIDPASAAIVASHTATARGNVYSDKLAWNNVQPGATRIWLGNSEYDLTSGELIRTVTDVPAGAGQYPSLYDPINHALIVQLDGLTWYYLDRVSGTPAVLGDAMDRLAQLVGVIEYSFAGLDQPLAGWSFTPGSAAAAAEPLLDAHDSDVRPHDFALQGVKRSGVAIKTITTPWFVSGSGGGGGGGDNSPRYSWRGGQPGTLPLSIVYSFADIEKDQQPNNTRPTRSAEGTAAKGEKVVDLGTYASDKDTMRNLAERHYRRLVNERRELTNALTAMELALEPADVVALDLDGQTARYRLTRVTVKANDVMACEWKYDHPLLAVLGDATGAALLAQAEDRIVVPGICKGFVFDVPLLRDADSAASPVLYLAAGAYSPSGGFPGAGFFREVGNEYSEAFGEILSGAGVTWGTVAEAMPATNPNMWDRGTALTLTLKYGSLTGTTEAAIDANPRANQAAIGAPGRWEIVNLTGADLTAPDTYTLTGFKRGRRGTEWAGELHQARDMFVLLDRAMPEALDLSDVGTDQSFKAVSNGRTLSGAYAIDLEPFIGASLKPYACVHLRAALTGSDWVLGWTRRTRLGGAWTGGAAIPLGEASEEYEVEILNGATAVRTVTGLTSPSFTYTAAMQTTDFGGAVTGVRFRVYQISDAVGRGFVAETARPTSAQWRLRFPLGSIGWAEPNVWEVEMRSVIGGADQCIGGVADASSEYSGSYPATNAFDGDLGGLPWAPLDNTPSWLRYAFAAPVSVAQLAVRSSGIPAPEQIILEYWDAAAAAWVPTYDTGTLASWGTNETKTFNV